VTESSGEAEVVSTVTTGSIIVTQESAVSLVLGKRLALYKISL
jgi:hypothetical protein